MGAASRPVIATNLECQQSESAVQHDALRTYPVQSGGGDADGQCMALMWSRTKEEPQRPSQIHPVFEPSILLEKPHSPWELTLSPATLVLEAWGRAGGEEQTRAVPGHSLEALLTEVGFCLGMLL